MDRYFKNSKETKDVSDLHLIGVTSMFLSSKFEDIYPLKMKTVFEKIGHQKLSIQEIKDLELDMMKVIKYKIHAPTVLDFLKVYLQEVLEVYNILHHFHISLVPGDKFVAYDPLSQLEPKID